MNVAYQHVHNRVPAPSSRVKGIPTPDRRDRGRRDRQRSERSSGRRLGVPRRTGRHARTTRAAGRARPAAHRARSRRRTVAAAPHPPASARADEHRRPCVTTGRTARTAPGGTGRTDNLRNNSVRHDTEIVDEATGSPATGRHPAAPAGLGSGAPPPSPPDRARRGAAARCAVGRRGACVGVRLWREWNTHVPKLTGLSVAAAQAGAAQDRLRDQPDDHPRVQRDGARGHGRAHRPGRRRSASRRAARSGWSCRSARTASRCRTCRGLDPADAETTLHRSRH